MEFFLQRNSTAAGRGSELWSSELHVRSRARHATPAPATSNLFTSGPVSAPTDRVLAFTIIELLAELKFHYRPSCCSGVEWRQEQNKAGTVDSGHLDSDPGDELISCVTRGPMLMLVQQRGFLVSRVQSDQRGMLPSSSQHGPRVL